VSEASRPERPGAGDASDLIARTVELDPARPVDLLAVAGAGGYLFEHEGVGIAGRGEALRIPLASGYGDRRSDVVAETLSSITATGGLDVAGARPLALGALPFDDGAPASMVVPEVVVGRDAGGRQWLTTVAPAGAAVPTLDELLLPVEAVELPDSFSLTSPRSHAAWQDTIADAVATIAAGDLAKVVVAREVLVEANRPIVVPDVLERLRALYPSCMVFSVDGFLGASPELLVERRGDRVRSHPLAGTYPRSGDPHADEVLAAELLASVKDRREHRFVIDEIVDVLGRMCLDLQVPEGPSILQLRNVLHLGTEIAGTLAAPAPTALDIAARLHPTPAVGGTPTKESLAWLERHEGLHRGHYAGPVGWVDAEGDGIFAVGIRSAEVRGPQARLFAGVGVVEGSDPSRELTETQLKLQALLAAVVRP
jgi:menaquinone-specific isochorismate synthase